MIESAIAYHEVDSGLTTREIADVVIRLCVSGRVDKARDILPTSGREPDLLLARGVTSYWLARTNGTSTYEAAKDSLTEAARLFIEMGETERSRLASVWAGLCYWREGQAAEASIMFKEATSSTDPHVRLLAHLNTTVLQTDHRRWREALATLESVRELLDRDDCAYLKGHFHQQRGLAYKLAYEETNSESDLDNALLEYEAASEHFEVTGNALCEAAILNNLGNLYRIGKQYSRAHNNVDRAASLYERLNDRSNLAQVKDTKALILLDEGQYRRAKRYADQSVALLSDHKGWLTGSLITRAKILCAMGMLRGAFVDFDSAINNARECGDLKAAADACVITIEYMAAFLSIHALTAIYTRMHELDGNRRTGAALSVLNRVVIAEAKSLKELKASDTQHEREIILKALEQTGGSITKAAELIGKTHGGLAHIIKTRHPDLVKNRRPVISRRKSAK
jgi:tetratricopeptide (TPR) repeat protein